MSDLAITGLVLMYTLGGALIMAGIMVSILSGAGIIPKPWKKKNKN